jgi:hypothetical protein
MWIKPKTNWTREDVPLPEDFNRIEGNVRELKEGADGLKEDFNRIEGNVRELKEGADGLKEEVSALQAAGFAEKTDVISDSGAVSAGATVSFPIPPYPLPPLSGHRYYLISVYSPTVTTIENAAELPGYVTWHLRRGKTGERDAVLITNSTGSTVTLYIKAAYIA